MQVTTFRMSDELDQKVESQLDYGDSKSEYIREAVELRLQLENEFDTTDTKEICETVTEGKKKIVDKDL
jgi:Arc/MetJ-type ribon-helix-helix transcriptional regulator